MVKQGASCKKNLEKPQKPTLWEWFTWGHGRASPIGKWFQDLGHVVCILGVLVFSRWLFFAPVAFQVCGHELLRSSALV